MPFLRVLELKATNLPSVDGKKGKSDPYGSLEFQGVKKKTEVIKDELNPVWNEKFEWDLGSQVLSVEENLIVHVKDWERIGRNRLLGSATVPLKDLVKDSSHTMQADVNLLDGNNRMTQAKLSLRLEYIPPKPSKNEEDITAVDETDLGAEPGDEGFEDELGIDEAEGGGAKGVGDGVRKKRRRRRTARHKLSNKPQDFQVRVRIIEGRQLAGSNISPVARITVANNTRQTKVKHSTNRPFYDETFFFNFQMSPLELFDEIISFEVFNSRKLRANAMIGYFKSDIGFFYDEPSHAVVRKWVLLTDPDDKMAGVKVRTAFIDVDKPLV